MRTALRIGILAALLAIPALGRAQASVELRLGLPVVMPRLVVVSPGVQVVPDVDEEIFYTNGWYWVRRDGGWYRTHNPRGRWFVIQPERVPHRLVNVPPGQYRRWRPAPPPPAAHRPHAAPALFRPAPAPRPEAYRAPDHGGHEGKQGGHGHGEKKGHGDRD